MSLIQKINNLESFCEDPRFLLISECDVSWLQAELTEFADTDHLAFYEIDTLVKDHFSLILCVTKQDGILEVK